MPSQSCRTDESWVVLTVPELPLERVSKCLLIEDLTLVGPEPLIESLPLNRRERSVGVP